MLTLFKHKRFSIDTTLKVNGTYLEDESVKQLVTQLKLMKGSDEQIHELKERLIINFIGMALRITGSYAAQATYLAQDLAGEALYHLVKAVDNIEKIEHENYTGYVTRCIHGGVLNYLRQERNRLVPRHESGKQREGVPCLMVESECRYRMHHFGDKHGQTRMHEIWEHLVWIINQEPDPERRLKKQHVVQLRMFGYTDDEIAQETGMTLALVNKLRREVRVVFTKHPFD